MLSALEIELIDSGLVRELNGLRTKLRKAKSINNTTEIMNLENKIKLAKELRKKLKTKGNM